MGARSPEAPTEPFWQTTGVTPLLSISTSVSVISGRLPELPWAWTLMRPAMARAHDLDGRRLADAGRVVVDEVALELLHLLVVEHDLGELADAGVGAVHDLARLDLVLEHGAADPDALHGRRVEFDLLAVARDAHELLDRQGPAVQNDGHSVSFQNGSAPAEAGSARPPDASSLVGRTLGRARGDARAAATCPGLRTQLAGARRRRPPDERGDGVHPTRVARRARGVPAA